MSLESARIGMVFVLLCNTNGRSAGTNDYINLGFNDLCCMLPKLVDAQSVALSIGQEVLPFDESLSA
jgi:hypothetical protein